MRLVKCFFVAAATLLVAAPAVSRADTLPIDEDVMTSGFFFSPNHVRGYAGDNRNVHRVSSNMPFGTSGAEAIYVTLDPSLISAYTSPVASAILTLESADGGFGSNADLANTFTVSAHAVSPDPLANITDDTNPGGPINWLDYFNNNIAPAAAASKTVVGNFGPTAIDVTSIVNDWISGANTTFAVAVTGKNDASGNDFLHGFLNDTENPGATFLTIKDEALQVPDSATAPFEDWSRGDQYSTYAEWDSFTVASGGVNETDIGLFGPGTPTVEQAIPGAIIASSGNLYNPAGASEFDVTVPGYDLGAGYTTQVVAQLLAGGTPVDPSSMQLSYDDGSGVQALSPTITPDTGSGWMFEWTIADFNPDSVLLEFSAAGAHMSLDRLVVDTFAVPEPATIAMLALGVAAAFGVARRRG